MKNFPLPCSPLHSNLVAMVSHSIWCLPIKYPINSFFDVFPVTSMTQHCIFYLILEPVFSLFSFTLNFHKTKIVTYGDVWFTVRMIILYSKNSVSIVLHILLWKSQSSAFISSLACLPSFLPSTLYFLSHFVSSSNVTDTLLCMENR